MDGPKIKKIIREYTKEDGTKVSVPQPKAIVKQSKPNQINYTEKYY